MACKRKTVKSFACFFTVSLLCVYDEKRTKADNAFSLPELFSVECQSLYVCWADRVLAEAFKGPCAATTFLRRRMSIFHSHVAGQQKGSIPETGS